jgi:hypothetical protein
MEHLKELIIEWSKEMIHQIIIIIVDDGEVFVLLKIIDTMVEMFPGRLTCQIRNRKGCNLIEWNSVKLSLKAHLCS